MLKQNFYQQQSSSNSSATPDRNSSTTQLDVFELVTENEHNAQTSLLLKLTDECNAAIRSAIKHKLPIRMHVKNGEATIEVPDKNRENVLKFKCSLQNQPPTDVICFDPQRKVYKNVGQTTMNRLQVQATDKTFAEMKEKTQRIIEADQQRKAKDVTQRTTVKGHQKSSHHPITAQRYQNKSLPSIPTTTSTSTNSGNAKFGAAITSSLKRTHTSLPYSKVVVPPKLCRKEIDVSSANKKALKVKQESKIGSPHYAKTNVMEMKRKTEEASISTKPLLNAASLAKEHIIKSQQFPKYETNTTTNVDDKKNLFYIPKRKPIHQRAPSISPASTATSTPKTISPPLPMARPASVDSNQLQHSSSCSPEDTVLNQEDQQFQQKIQDGFVTLTTKPSQDWSQKFGKIETTEDAKRYLDVFKSDYPEYRQCYEELERVANEFRALQDALKRAVDNSEQYRVETQIRSKFAAYQCDRKFLRKRQRHHDLRAKLEVIKHALSLWNEKTDYNRTNATTVPMKVHAI